MRAELEAMRQQHVADKQDWADRDQHIVVEIRRSLAENAKKTWWSRLWSRKV